MIVSKWPSTNFPADALFSKDCQSGVLCKADISECEILFLSIDLIHLN